MKTVFGRTIFSVLLVFSLVAASCNTNENRRDVRVRESDDGTEDVRVRENFENDTASFERERTIRQNDEGDRTIREEVDVEAERD